MACSNCGGFQTGGTYTTCPDGTQPTYQYILYDLAISNEVPVQTIGPFDHATALLELQEYLNPPILPAVPIEYSVIQVQFCGQQEISRTDNFPLTCGGNYNIPCLPPNTCLLVQWNSKDCVCCGEGQVYCRKDERCVALPQGCTLERWNPITCQCCPVGYIYCQATGQCELPENCNPGTGCPPGQVYCVETGLCVTPPEDCPPYQYNESNCTCCPDGSVYCIATGECVNVEDIPCIIAQWNQRTCECCPPGSVYCRVTGQCVPLPVSCIIIQWNPVTCQCCPLGYVFCNVTATCIPLPGDCTIVQYNPNTCECCPEGQVFCATTGTCIPLPNTCTVEQWNPLTCTCCPAGSIFYGVECQVVCDPADYSPITLDWSLAPTGGGIIINGVEGAGGQQATHFTVIITPTSGQGVPITMIQYPVPLNPNEPPVTLPLSIPLLAGNYSFVIYGIHFGDCVLEESVNGTITGVLPLNCCQTIANINGGNEVRYLETDITIPIDAVAPYKSFIDLYTIYQVDRVSAYVDDGSGTWIEIAQSPFIGSWDLPTAEYPALAFTQGAENGYWRNLPFPGSLTAPYRYASIGSGDPTGVEFPNSDFGFDGSNNYLTPAYRGQHNLVPPPGFPFAGVNTGKARLFFNLPEDAEPLDVVRVKFRIEGGNNGTIWYAQPGCLINAACENCEEVLPIPDECCPFSLVKNLQAELNQPAGTAISIVLPTALVPVNGVAPYIVSVVFNPGSAAGLTYNAGTQKITGTLLPGPLAGIMTITDAQGCTVTQIFSRIIACPSIELRAPAGSTWDDLTIGDVYVEAPLPGFNLSFATIGGTAPFTFALALGTVLPTGLSVVTNAVTNTVASIVGTVGGVPGAYNVVLEATDANGCTAQLAFILNVDN